MIDSLVKSLIFDRVQKELPTNSYHSTYLKVENAKSYLLARELLLNIAISHGILAITKYCLDVIEGLMGQDNTIVADNIHPETRQSLLIIMRLLNDCMAVYWDSKGDKELPERPNSNDDQNEYKRNTNPLAGFSTDRPNFHARSPEKLKTELVVRLLSVCSKLKCHTTTIDVISSSSEYIFSGYLHLRYTVLTNHQEKLKVAAFRAGAIKMDSAIAYAQSYVAASNSDDFDTFIQKKILTPYLIDQSSTDTEIVEHLDFLSCISISPNNILHYLDIIKELSSSFKRSVFNAILLQHASKALMGWIISKPLEYVEWLSVGLESTSISTSTRETYHDYITKESSNPVEILFDQIYSEFNVSSLLMSYSKSSNSPFPNNSQVSSSFSQYPSNNSNNISTSISSTSLTGTSSHSPFKYSNSNTSQLSSHSELTTVPSPSSVPSDVRGEHKLSTTPVRTEEIQPVLTQVHDLSDVLMSVIDTEMKTHSSIFLFLSVLIMLDRDMLNEMNLPGFKGFSNLDPPSAPERKSSFYKDSQSNDNPYTKGYSIKYFRNGLRKLKNLTPQKKNNYKFMTTILMNFNGAYQVSDVAMLDSLSAILPLFSMASSVSLVTKDTPSFIFANKLYELLGHNFNVGKGWKSKSNRLFTNFSQRNPLSTRNLQIKFFISALQLQPKNFLSHINLTETLNKKDTSALYLYIEGFKLLFNFQNTMKIWRAIYIESSSFFKVVFSSGADILLDLSPHWNDSYKEILNLMLTDRIKEEFILEELFSSIISKTLAGSCFTPLSDSSVIKNDISEKHLASVDSDSLLFNSFKDSNCGNTAGSEIMHDIVLSDSKILESTNCKNPPLLSPSPEYGRMISNVTNQIDSLTHFSNLSLKNSFDSINIPRCVISPTRKQLATKKSDDAVSKNTHEETQSQEHIIYANYISENEIRMNMVHLLEIFTEMLPFTFYDKFINKHDDKWQISTFENVVIPMLCSLLDSDRILQETAQTFLNVRINCQLSLNEKSSMDDVMGNFMITGYTIIMLSSLLLDLTLPADKRENLLSILLDVMATRSHLITVAISMGCFDEFLEKNENLVSTTSKAIGRALFISLYCEKSKIQKIVTEAYSLYYEAINKYSKAVGKCNYNWIDNIRFIKECSVESNIPSGSLAFQRRLSSNIIKHIDVPDPILVDCILLIYDRWLTLSRVKATLTKEELSDFRSLASIIAITSGIFLSNETLEKYPYAMKFRDIIAIKIDYFIGKQCEWINDTDLLTREKSREIVSNELHLSALNLLFKNLRLKIISISSINLSDDANELSFVLLEQIIIIVRVVLERDGDKNANSNMVFVSLAIIDLINILITHVEKIPQDSLHFYKAVIHMSKMLKAMQNSERRLALVGHYQLKNKWLKLVVKWFNTTIINEYDFENLSKSHREMNLLKRDIDILCLDTAIESSKALNYLTKDVPLEYMTSSSKEEITRSKFIEFGKYFSIFSKGLERISSFDNFPSFIKHKLKLLNSNIIISLMNLSNANSEAGFKYALPLGYSPNREIRIAFLGVFTNIIKSMPIRREETKKIKIEVSKRVVECITQHPSFISEISTVCPSGDIEEYIAGLVNAFGNTGLIDKIIHELIKSEISRASRPFYILRGNSCATTALSLYSGLKGNEYLVRTLKPVLTELVNSEDFFDIEKLELSDPEVEKEVPLFMNYLEKIIDSLYESISYFPKDFFKICQIIHSSTYEKFPDHALIAVGSFFFLRFLCPSIVNPEPESIITVVDYRKKKTCITLAKMLQSIANGTDNFIKWSSLTNESENLKRCSERIFEFLKVISDPKREVELRYNEDINPPLYDLNFLHKYIYYNELKIREELLKVTRTSSSISFLKDTFLLFDKMLEKFGQPLLELKIEIPEFVKQNHSDHTELYDFMSKYIFRNQATFSKKSIPFLHESISSNGFPTTTLIFKKFKSFGITIDDILFKTLQAYSRVWSSKHYFAFDCTDFDEREVDINNLIYLLTALVPQISRQTCIGYYYYNVTPEVMNYWSKFFKHPNPFFDNINKHHYINSSEDIDTVKILSLSAKSIEVVNDCRVYLNDITLFDEISRNFNHVSLKIGNNYFQILHLIPKKFSYLSDRQSININYNTVYQIIDITSVNVSSKSGLNFEFTVVCDGKNLIFRSAKHLDIIKLFKRSISTIENNYSKEGERFSFSEDQESDVVNRQEHDSTIAHIFLMVILGLLCADNKINDISYNLLVVTKDSFNLKFHMFLYQAPQRFVPRDAVSLFQQLSKSIAKNSPELMQHILKFLLDALQNGTVPHEDILSMSSYLSKWIPNLYEHVYLSNERDGATSLSQIVRTLIRLSVNDIHHTLAYVQNIWVLFILDGRLTDTVVDEVINYALEREYENKDWKNVISLVTSLQTVDVVAHVIKKLMNIINSFSSSLKYESSTESWSELSILVKMCVQLFFQNTLLAQRFLPDVLFIISLLIDMGPLKLREMLHELLMNTCHSLIINESLSANSRCHLEKICEIFSHQKLKFISGFSQDERRVVQKLSSASFYNNFITLEYFTDNIMLVMEYSELSGSSYWKSQYKKYLLNSVFCTNSFLSVRALMITGFICRSSISENVCRNLLSKSIAVIADPKVYETQYFLIIAHVFTYSKIVEALDPSRELVKQLFWLSSIFVLSAHPIIFEGGLIFLVNSLKRMYMANFEDSSSTKLIVPTLLDSRKFAEPILLEFDKLHNVSWNEDNFTHILLSAICKGLSIPFVKDTAVYSLEHLFRNSYYEHTLNSNSTDYLSYLLLMYLVLNTGQFNKMLNAVEFEEDGILLDESNRLPLSLVEWLLSNDSNSQITLYQCAMIFSSQIFDEASKYRFLLVVKHLLQCNPLSVFRFYNVARNEILRQSTLEHNLLNRTSAFSIIELIVQQKEYSKLNKYNEQSLQFLKDRSLMSVIEINVFDPMEDSEGQAKTENMELVYQRKRLIVLLLSKISK